MSQLQVKRLRIDGIEDVQRLCEGQPDTTCVPLASIVPRGSVVRAEIGEVVLTASRLHADVRYRACIKADNISFGMYLHSDATVFSFGAGREALPGDVRRLVRGDVLDVRFTGEVRNAAITLSTDLLLRHGGEDALRGDIAFWEQGPLFRAPQETRDLIDRSVRRIISYLSQPNCQVTGQALRQLQADLIERFLWGALLDERKPGERRGLASAAIVHKSEKWLDGRSPETIRIGDLCRALHVSRRTLHRAFAEALGMGPLHYLTRRRLAAVRTELRRRDFPPGTTVTDVATRYGFWQLGRFAQQYRQLFGERPSETLGRASKPAASPRLQQCG